MEEVLELITLIFSIITLTINIFITTNENKKNKIVDIVTRQRLEEMNLLREYFAKFYSLIEINNVTNKLLIDDILLYSAKIDSLLKYIYVPDKRIILIKNKVIEYLEIYIKDKKLHNDYNLHIELFYKTMSLYLYCNWVCIKEQTTGKKYGSLNFQNVYNMYESKFLTEKDIKIINKYYSI